MRQNKRTQWTLWQCDAPGCPVQAATHREFGDPEMPDGWTIVRPPRFWKGPALAFHSEQCRRTFVVEWAQQEEFLPLLGAGRASDAD